MNKTLELVQADHGGYMVTTTQSGREYISRPIFYAGSLKKCLRYMRKQMIVAEASRPAVPEVRKAT